jgi:CRP/FNR family cyclic AMP-dependent transcriptional regulator
MSEPVQSKLWYLKRFNLFEEFDPAEMEALVPIAHMEKAPVRQVLYLPDDPSDRVFFLKEGRVKISKLSEEGKEVTLAILEQGEIFGELALVDEGPRGTVAEVLEDTFICYIERSDFEKLLDHKPELALKVSKLIGARRKALEAKVGDLVFRDVNARLAKLLLELAESYGTVVSEGVRIDVKLTHRELANLIGSTRETTTAALNDFRRRGFIDNEKRRLIVIDRSSLEAVAA